MKNIRLLIMLSLYLINISAFATSTERCVDVSYSDCYKDEMVKQFKKNEWKWDNESTASLVMYYKFTSDGVEIWTDDESIGTFSVEWINSYDVNVEVKGSWSNLKSIIEHTISFVINMNGTYILINSIYNYKYWASTSSTSDLKEEMCVYYATNEEDAISNNFQEFSNLTTCTTYE